jgi:hypothetical protein
VSNTPFLSLTDGTACPHCGAIARVEPKGLGAKLRWVCGVCGGPRMPGGVGGEDSLGPLREAKASQTRSKRARASFWVFAMMATFFTLVAVAAWPAALVWKLFFLALAIAPTVFAVRARARAAGATVDAKEALDRAWLAAAEDVAKSAKNGVTVAELAKRLKVDPVRAEELLTQLAVHERTRIDVDDDAEVRYSISPEEGDATKVRVDSSEDQFRALEEAEATSRRGEDEAEAAQKALLSVPFPRGPQR